jgi:uncharacterized membrane protein
LTIAAVVVAKLLGADGKSGEVSGTLVIHNERFAKGEIDKAEYEERRTMLLS